MQEALHPVIEVGFNQMGLEIIEATVEQGNDRSINLLRKLKFEKETELRDQLIYFYLNRQSWRNRYLIGPQAENNTPTGYKQQLAAHPPFGCYLASLGILLAIRTACPSHRGILRLGSNHTVSPTPPSRGFSLPMCSQA
ncbi:GNAT family N-acetyltransferase [Cohnella faecalis]|uniref:GNAT family N-acetyltransferase n=1 Tax=Cohnella faecalis TaxID=2315694 RepID=UPI002D7958BA|nr:GNAT family protein [Cohnella faecalis]